MAENRSTQQLACSSLPVRAVLQSAEQHEFPVRLIGHSRGPILPQRVGQWWMEPLNEASHLPPRARQRLHVLLAADVRPKAVVLFHELPGPRRPPRAWERGAARMIGWTQYELPALLERSVETIRAHAPAIGTTVLRMSGAVAVGLGLVVWHLLGALALAATADPCLVIVTEDGYWIEVDRWYA